MTAGAGGGAGASKWDKLADRLIPYVTELGFTHVELMPVMEHLLDASLGYQVSGYFSPTARYGSPDDFRRFVDRLHQAGIGPVLAQRIVDERAARGPFYYPADLMAVPGIGQKTLERLLPRLAFGRDTQNH